MADIFQSNPFKYIIPFRYYVDSSVASYGEATLQTERNADNLNIEFLKVVNLLKEY